jgi:hypothetical protein
MYYSKYLDMVRAIICSSSGGQNCMFTASGIVTFCERPCSAPVESGLRPLSTGTRFRSSFRIFRFLEVSLHLLLFLFTHPHRVSSCNLICIADKIYYYYYFLFTAIELSLGGSSPYTSNK